MMMMLKQLRLFQPPQQQQQLFVINILMIIIIFPAIWLTLTTTSKIIIATETKTTILPHNIIVFVDAIHVESPTSKTRTRSTITRSIRTTTRSTSRMMMKYPIARSSIKSIMGLILLNQNMTITNSNPVPYLPNQQRKQRNTDAAIDILCRPDCGPFGVCIAKKTHCQKNNTTNDDIMNDNCPTIYKCECQTGYSGTDCSTPTDQCPGPLIYNKGIDEGADIDHSCYNGGICQLSEVNTNVGFDYYECDCSIAIDPNRTDDMSMMDEQCQYHSEIISCEYNEEYSNIAYCVNGGYCRIILSYDNIMKMGGVTPCVCPTGLFEGRHCQYRTGMMPYEENDYIIQQMEIYNLYIQKINSMKESQNTSSSSSALAAIGYTLIGIVVVGICIYYVKYKYSNSNNNQLNDNNHRIRRNKARQQFVATRTTSNNIDDYDDNNDMNDNDHEYHNDNHNSNDDEDDDDTTTTNNIELKTIT